MTRILATAIVLYAAGTAAGGILPAPIARPAVDVLGLSPPDAPKHPAVCRVIVAERGGFSLGSGALVAVNVDRGLVVTNWHVVRDAAGPITVVFPDGFRSSATVLKTDRDWDLAALAVWRPGADPIPLAGEAPRHGEPLTIIGYGSGQYRAATGRCVQYLSPGKEFPAELVELSAAARQGDSGGPILNSRGELAGILFGASLGRTAGSYCGRVRSFLTPITGEFRDVPRDAPMIAGRATPHVPVAASARGEPVAAPGPVASIPSQAVASQAGPSDRSAEREDSRGALPQSASPKTTIAADAGPSWGDQVKTLLAVIGGIAILLQAVKLAGASESA